MRTRVLRTFVKRGLIDKDDAAGMRAWEHDGGYSVDGSLRIEGADRTGLERLLRCCACPPFALAQPYQRDAGHLVYRNPKGDSGLRQRLWCYSERLSANRDECRPEIGD